MAFSFNLDGVSSATSALNGITADINTVSTSSTNVINAVSGLLNGTGVSSLTRDGNTLTSFINNTYGSNGLLQYIYTKIFKELMPDISGYVLLFMVPPKLSGYINLGNSNYEQFGTSFFGEVSGITPVLATTFTPPTIEMSTSVLSGPSGSQHFATNLNITDNMSVTFIDTKDLDIYTMHSTWLDYIYQVQEGTLEPSAEMISNRTIDYAGSFYFVKYQADMQTIQYVGKAIGVFPKGMPNMEVLGTRSSNELTTFTMNYVVSDFREATMKESNSWLFSELESLILSQYAGTGTSVSTSTTNYASNIISGIIDGISSIF